MLMPLPRCLVALPLLALAAGGHDDGRSQPEVEQVEGNRLRRIRTEEEFNAMLTEERAALLFFGRWSQDAVISRGYVEAWVRQRQPRFGVYLVAPEEQPYARRWLEEQGLDNSFHPYESRGAVLLLRRGAVAAEARRGGVPYDPLELHLLAEQTFGNGR
jgi:hypothetical protein